MAATFKTFCDAAFVTAVQTSLLGETVTIRGVEYAAVVDAADETEDFIAGGSTQSTPISAVLARRTFSPALTLGERITYGGVNYTIRKIDDDGISFLTLIGQSPSKR